MYPKGPSYTQLKDPTATESRGLWGAEYLHANLPPHPSHILPQITLALVFGSFSYPAGTSYERLVDDKQLIVHGPAEVILQKAHPLKKTKPNLSQSQKASILDLLLFCFYTKTGSSYHNYNTINSILQDILTTTYEITAVYCTA